MRTVQTQLETTRANATWAILEVDFSVKVSLDVCTMLVENLYTYVRNIIVFSSLLIFLLSLSVLVLLLSRGKF